MKNATKLILNWHAFPMCIFSHITDTLSIRNKEIGVTAEIPMKNFGYILRIQSNSNLDQQTQARALSSTAAEIPGLNFIQTSWVIDSF